MPASGRSEPAAPRWHQALAYALLGRTEQSLGSQALPDLPGLVADLDRRYPDGRSGLLADVARARTAGENGWPRVVPDELRAGLGAAQFAAVLADLCRLLGLERASRRTLSERPPNAAEQALLRDVPPHHGG